MDHDATRSILRFSRINDVISFKLSELIASYRYNICRLMIIFHWPMEHNAILSIWYWKCFLAGHSSLVMFRDGRARCKQHACAKWFESETMFESQALRLKVFAHSRTEVMSVSCLQLFFESALNTNSCLNSCSFLLCINIFKVMSLRAINVMLQHNNRIFVVMRESLQ